MIVARLKRGGTPITGSSGLPCTPPRTAGSPSRALPSAWMHRRPRIRVRIMQREVALPPVRLPAEGIRVQPHGPELRLGGRPGEEGRRFYRNDA